MNKKIRKRFEVDLVGGDLENLASSQLSHF